MNSEKFKRGMTVRISHNLSKTGYEHGLNEFMNRMSGKLYKINKISNSWTIVIEDEKNILWNFHPDDLYLIELVNKKNIISLFDINNIYKENSI